MTKKSPVSHAGQQRVGEKIGHLVSSGEVPNTKAGRKQAADMAYGMERSGRLGAGGTYRPAPAKPSSPGKSSSSRGGGRSRR